MKMILRSRIFCAALAGILSMCAMSSCASVPEPEAFNLTIQSLSHEVDGQDVIFQQRYLQEPYEPLNAVLFMETGLRRQ